MKTTLKILFLLALISSCEPANADAQTSPTTNTAVTALIKQLVSPVPAKYPSGETDFSNEFEDMNGFIHPQVENARKKLIDMGTDIYPILAEHIHDDRYSYSGVYAAWLNHSVGYMVSRIMAEGIEPNIGSYKSRKNPTGSNGPPSFSKMVEEFGGFEKYALMAKGRRKSKLQTEYVQWHVAKERGYGFIDKAQEQKIISKYLELINEK